MDIQRVPVEVLQHIFQYVDGKWQIKQLLVVCKRWNEIATPLHFKDLTLDATRLYQLKKILAIDDQEEHKRYFKHCKHINSIRIINDEFAYIDYRISKELEKDACSVSSKEFSWYGSKSERMDGKYCKLDENEFANFFSLLTHLESVDFGESKYYEDYMGYLKVLHGIEGINRISFKREHWGGGKKNPYYEVCYKYRETLNELCVRNEEEKSSMPFDGFAVNTLDYLSHFAHLKKLKFINNDSDAKFSNIDIHKTCPNLTNLIYLSNKSTNNQNIIAETVALSQGNLSTPSYMQNLKKLTLDVPALSAAQINFFVKFLPKGMNELAVNVDSTDLYDWMENVGVENVLRLAEYQSHLACARLSSDVDKYYERATFAERKVDRAFRVLRKLKGDRSLYCTATFSDIRSVHCQMSVEDNKYLKLQYGMDFEDYGDNQIPEEEQERAYDRSSKFAPSLPFDMPLPNIQETGLGFEIINNMTFWLCRVNVQHPPQLLRFALVNCPYIHFAKFEGCNSPKYQIILSSLKGREAEYERARNPQQKSKDVLVYAKLNGYLCYKDILNILASHLPGLKRIICKDVDSYAYSRYGNPNMTSNEKCLCLNFTSFTKLKRLSFDISITAEKDETPENVILCLKFSAGDEEYYNITNEQKASKKYAVVPIDREKVVELEGNKDVSYRGAIIHCHKDLEELKLFANEYLVGVIKRDLIPATIFDYEEYYNQRCN